MPRIRALWPERYERLLCARLARRPRGRPAAASPAILLFSVVVWLLPVVFDGGRALSLARVATPWVSTAALVFQAFYLISVVLRVLDVCHRRADESGDRSGAIAVMRGAALKVLNILLGIVLFAPWFEIIARNEVEASYGAGVARLIWMTCIGGMMLAVFVGEWVMRLMDVFAAATSAAACAADPARASEASGRQGP